MPLRPPAGFIRPGFDPLKNPNAPTAVAATGGDESASVSFTPPANVGGSAISAYYAVSNPGQITGTGASSPVSVTGLTNGTAYTFSVWALNTYGPSAFSASSGSVTPSAPIGLFGGGSTGSSSNVIQYITIASTGNATDFGDLTVAKQFLAACASSTRGVFGGGSSATNVIGYVTISSAGNATSFGDLTAARYGLASAGSSTRGLFYGGVGADFFNVIDYITIASTGNATDFGDSGPNPNPPYLIAGASNPTRAVFAGGTRNANPDTSSIYYVTIATTGNAAYFGDLTSTMSYGSACSSSTRAVFGGGYRAGNYSNVLDYITIASTGNATDFGDLTTDADSTAACSSSTRGVWGGGNRRSRSNIMDYITIASAGNATDFGDLLSPTDVLAACSNANGGL
jgi:hypothetical protein